MDIQIEKDSLRQQCKKKRKQQNIEIISQKVASNIIKSAFFKFAKHIMIYMPLK